MNATLNILLVEDESSIADAVRYAFEREGFGFSHAPSAREGIAIFRASQPSLVILDIGLPDASGFDVCRTIRGESRVPVVFLTARAEEVDKVLGLEIGGDDYVTKPFSPRELVARVRAILRRITDEPPTPSVPKPAKGFYVDTERMHISLNGVVLPLVRYEYRLLCILLRRPGRVYSREQLMNLAWEVPEMSLERTVDTHIKTLRSKLREVDSATEWIVTHRGVGYSLREEP